MAARAGEEAKRVQFGREQLVQQERHPREPGHRDSPGRFNFETSLYKTFRIHESTNFEFRAESFNTFNHTEFNNVGSSFGNSTFGQLTATWDPPVLQFGTKLNF